MIEKVDVGMAPSSAPVSDAIKAGQQVWLVAIPEDPATGVIIGDDIGAQTERTIGNLERAMTAAGGSLRDIVQVQIFLIDAADAPGMNAVYRRLFSEPYPVRATVVVKELLGQNMRVEMLATAVI